MAACYHLIRLPRGQLRSAQAAPPWPESHATPQVQVAGTASGRAGTPAGPDSIDSGTPRSKKRIGRGRRGGRGGIGAGAAYRPQASRQPGHQGKGLAGTRIRMSARARSRGECRRRGRLAGVVAAGGSWRAQVIDVDIIQTVTEWPLPGPAVPCCVTVRFASRRLRVRGLGVLRGGAERCRSGAYCVQGTCRLSGPRTSWPCCWGCGVAGLGGQGQRPAARAAEEGRVRRRWSRSVQPACIQERRQRCAQLKIFNGRGYWLLTQGCQLGKVAFGEVGQGSA
jgi:hypothetical protein